MSLYVMYDNTNTTTANVRIIHMFDDLQHADPFEDLQYADCYTHARICAFRGSPKYADLFGYLHCMRISSRILRGGPLMSTIIIIIIIISSSSSMH